MVKTLTARSGLDPGQGARIPQAQPKKKKTKKTWKVFEDKVFMLLL